MRPLTPFVSYFDNAGRLLVGRVRFCNLDGSPAEVFADDAGTTTLGSTVYTNAVGRMDVQPFLEDHDYILYFDRYIGNGTMAEDDDPESWEEQGSAVNKYNTLGISVEGDVVMSVGSIADLRRTDPDTTGVFRTVNLLGYNEPGDKPTVEYRWEPAYVGGDNGGSAICVEGRNRGAWMLVECPRHLDVRHFGAFPLSTSEENTVQRYAIQNAMIYARSKRCGLYFFANSAACYYDITGLTLYDVDSDDRARVFAVNGSQGKATVIGIDNIVCGGNTNGHIELISETVRTSWGGDYVQVKFSPEYRLVVDATLVNVNTTRTWEDKDVELLVDPGPSVYKNCRISANKVISTNLTIRDCELDTSWFADGYDWDLLTSTGNKITLDKCSDANTYILLKNKQNEADYGDLGGKHISNIELGNQCSISNAIFDDVSVQGTSSLSDVSGTATFKNSSTITMNNCWIALKNAPVILKLAVYGGSLSGYTQPSSVSANVFTLVNADIDIGLEGGFLSCNIRNSVIRRYANLNALNAEYTTFMSTVSAHNITAFKCTFMDEVSLSYLGDFRIFFYDNIVYDGVRLHIFRHNTSVVTNAKVQGYIVGNTILGNRNNAFWIEIDRTGIDEDDRHHEYEYRDNAGGMPKRLEFDATLGAYGWGEWHSGPGMLNLVVTPTVVPVIAEWYIEFYITNNDGIFIPNTFSFGTNSTGKCRIKARITASDPNLFGNFEKDIEFIGMYNRSSGLVTAIRNVPLELFCNNDFSHKHLTNPYSKIWEFEEEEYVRVKENAPTPTIIIEPID